ncbi:hypothetical protein GCM10028832_46640 [Streptomyces sparsus]
MIATVPSAACERGATGLSSVVSAPRVAAAPVTDSATTHATVTTLLGHLTALITFTLDRPATPSSVMAGGRIVHADVPPAR